MDRNQPVKRPNSRGGIDKDTLENLSTITAQWLVEQAQERVIGQDEALNELADYIAMRCACMCAYAYGVDDEDLPKTRACFMIGPTASGKTYLARTMLKLVCDEVISIDCTPLTGTGWRGDNIKDKFEMIYEALAKHKGGVIGVIWDEADKLAKPPRPGFEGERSFDPQYDFLNYLDGGIPDLTDSKRNQNNSSRYLDSNKTNQQIDQQRIINVLCGAFDGIDKYVSRRIESVGVGFGSKQSGKPTEDNLRRHVAAEDLAMWGFIREFLGRVGAFISMPALTEDELVRIASYDHGPIARASAALPPGVSFTAEDEPLRSMAQAALKSKLGARAIETEVNKAAAKALRIAQMDDGASSITLTSIEPEISFRVEHDAEKRKSAQRLAQAEAHKADIIAAIAAGRPNVTDPENTPVNPERWTDQGRRKEIISALSSMAFRVPYDPRGTSEHPLWINALARAIYGKKDAEPSRYSINAAMHLRFVIEAISVLKDDPKDRGLDHVYDAVGSTARLYRQILTECNLSSQYDHRCLERQLIEGKVEATPARLRLLRDARKDMRMIDDLENNEYAGMIEECCARMAKASADKDEAEELEHDINDTIKSIDNKIILV